MPSDICYVNGAFSPVEEAKISILDRGFLFGDAIYEVLRVHNGKCFRVREHYDRMVEGLTGIRIEMPLDFGAYEALCRDLVAKNGVQVGLVYLQITRGAAPRQHRLPQGITPTIVGFARTVAMPSWRAYPEGVPVCTVSDLRWQRCNFKTTMLLPNCIAKEEASEAGGFEAVLVSEHGVVREGSSTNVFMVKDGALQTHPLDHHILPSITRLVILEIARKARIDVIERAFTRDDLLAADECLLGSTTSDVCPVVRVDNHPIGHGRIGEVTRRLMALYAELLESETR